MPNGVGTQVGGGGQPINVAMSFFPVTYSTNMSIGSGNDSESGYSSLSSLMDVTQAAS